MGTVMRCNEADNARLNGSDRTHWLKFHILARSKV